MITGVKDIMTVAKANSKGLITDEKSANFVLIAVLKSIIRIPESSGISQPNEARSHRVEYRATVPSTSGY